MNFDALMASPATLALLATNLIFSIVGFGNVRLLDTFLFDIGRIRRNGEWYRTVTSGFIHADPIHLFMNMFSLFFIGPALESIGTWQFLAFYMACLVGGSAWTLMEHWRNLNYRALGASGAVSGITAAFGIFAPFAMIIFFVIPMPAILFAILFILYSAWASRSASGALGNIGHAAHLGGALTGVALVCIFYPAAMQNTWQEILARLPI